MDITFKKEKGMSVFGSVVKMVDRIRAANFQSFITGISLNTKDWNEFRTTWNRESLGQDHLYENESYRMWMGITIRNANKVAWSCPHCGAGLDALQYAQDVTAMSRVIKVENGKAFIADVTDVDWSCPTNQRLWCTECDHYFYDDDGANCEIEI